MPGARVVSLAFLGGAVGPVVAQVSGAVDGAGGGDGFCAGQAPAAPVMSIRSWTRWRQAPSMSLVILILVPDPGLWTRKNPW